MTVHSVLPPSSAHIWGARNGCPGWAAMVKNLPKSEPTEESLAGDAAHELGAVLTSRYIASGSTVDYYDLLGKPADNGVIWDEKIYNSVLVYLKKNAEIIDRNRPNFDARVEHRLNMYYIHKKCFGTCDFFLCGTHEVHINEYKNGYAPINAFENWQCLTYLNGVAQIQGAALHPDTDIYIHVTQPNSYKPEGPVDTWHIKYSEALEYFKILRENARIAMEQPFTRAGSHCKYCDARFNCATAIESGLSLYEAVNIPRMVEGDNEAFALYVDTIQRAFEQVESLKKGAEEKLKCMLKNGENVPGYDLTPTYGRKTWNVSNGFVREIGKAFNVNTDKDGVITPRQAIDAGVPAEVVEQISKRNRTGLKLEKNLLTLVKRIFKNG